MRLVTSDLALRAVLALGQTGPASLAALAGVLRVPPSSAQRALEILLSDRLVVAVGDGRARRYALVETSPALEAVEQLAHATLPPRQVLELVALSNPAVEFFGLGADRTITVFARRSSLADQSRAMTAITKPAGGTNLDAQFYEHADLRRERDRTAELRRVLSTGEVLVGDLDRSIPDRSAHRKTAGQALGRINPALHLPSRRTIQAIKRRRHVRGIRVFGSAVRTDFRPDSDIDIAITLDPSASASVATSPGNTAERPTGRPRADTGTRQSPPGIARRARWSATRGVGEPATVTAAWGTSSVCRGRS